MAWRSCCERCCEGAGVNCTRCHRLLKRPRSWRRLRIRPAVRARDVRRQAEAGKREPVHKG